MKEPVLDGVVYTVDLPLLHCYRCGYTWTPRHVIVRICPRCKSPYFDEPKIRVPSAGGGQGIEQVLAPHRKEIYRIARKHGVREIRVFGSVARGSATSASDIDLLVEFRGPPHTSDLRRDLEGLLHRNVDVVTDSMLHWYVQPQVVVEAVPL